MNVQDFYKGYGFARVIVLASIILIMLFVVIRSYSENNELIFDSYKRDSEGLGSKYKEGFDAFQRCQENQTCSYEDQEKATEFSERFYPESWNCCDHVIPADETIIESRTRNKKKNRRA